jgi:transposase
MLKYTIAYDGMFGSFAQIHTDGKYANESLALPENVVLHVKKCEDHASVYLFDRGQSSTAKFVEMKSHQGLLFVGRLQEKRKLNIVKEFDLTFKKFEFGILKMDALVRLYKVSPVLDKNGNEQRKLVLDTETFRVIRFRQKNKKEDIILITNILYLPAQTIASMYRRRWDIEVFFRFLKQEINFSHFLSLNENGIEVILYMTLIAAMLIMIYKKENEIGFKTAKRRIEIELQELILATVVRQVGGDISKVKHLNINPFPP